MDFGAEADSSSSNICHIPTVLEFDWYESQEMHASIYI